MIHGNETHPAGFKPTRWTLVERSRGNSAEAKSALRELCEAYYAPVVAFLQRVGNQEDLARDLAHEFFEKLLSAGSLQNAEQTRGRFRSYLLGAIKHFLINKRRDDARQKWGGGVDHLAINPGTDTSPGLDVVDHRALPPDALFDRQWALAIIDRALLALEHQHHLSGQGQLFCALRPCISPGGESLSQAQTAAALNMSEGAVKVAIHRLRQKFRELVRQDILQTLDDPSELDAEMQHMVTVLAKGGE